MLRAPFSKAAMTVLFFAIAATACGAESAPSEAADTDDPGVTGNEGIAGDAVEPGAALSESYPEGPYGENNPALGQVVENLLWRGLYNGAPPGLTADIELTPYSLDDFRKSGQRYLLLITAMGWCGSCQGAARQLGSELRERVVELHDGGGAIMHLLLQGGGSASPTNDELVNWARAAELSISVMAPAEGASGERSSVVFPQREWGFILRLDTMQVVWRQQVALYSTPTVSQQGVAELERHVFAAP